MTELKEEFEKLTKETLQDEIFSSEFKRKKLKIYLIRTLIAAVIIFFLWDYKWIKWVLYFYIPLNLLSLVSIYAGDLFLSKKIKRTQRKIEELDSYLEEE